MRTNEFPFPSARSLQRIRVFVLLFFIATFAQTPQAADRVLRWGADAEGGAPFAFADPENPNRVIGYEVDIVQAIANEMHRTPVFVQNAWDGLIPGLNRGNYDMIINGLEITDDRKNEIAFSDPYYITYEQLVVRQKTHDITTLEDCHGRKVGTLKFTLAQRLLEKAGGIKVLSYDDDVNPYIDLERGRLDAVLMDLPIAIYYGQPNPRLKFIGQPFGRMEYGIGVRKSDPALLTEINRALRQIIQNGTLRIILEDWKLWNPMMASCLKVSVTPQYPPSAYETFLKNSQRDMPLRERIERYARFLPLLGRGAIMTLEISLLSMALAVVLGLALALLKLYAPTPFPRLAGIYIEAIRGTPLLIQLFFIFYALPAIGIKFTPYIAAVLGLGLNYAAYEAENYRAGILSVPRQQMEAAFALGMGSTQALRHIILPQAMRLVIPPITNDFISLLKDSSLVSVITMVELTKVYGQIASTYYDYFGTGLIVAAIYFLLGLPFVRLARYAEKKLARERRVTVRAPERQAPSS